MMFNTQQVYCIQKLFNTSCTADLKTNFEVILQCFVVYPCVGSNTLTVPFGLAFHIK